MTKLFTLAIDQGHVKNIAGDGGFNTSANNINVIVNNLILVVLGLLGVIFLLLVIYAGFTYMTSAGDSKKNAAARNAVISAVIGMVIIIAAYAITYFVGGRLGGEFFK